MNLPSSKRVRTIEEYCQQIKCFQCNNLIEDYDLDISYDSKAQCTFTIIVYCHGESEEMKFSTEFKNQILENYDKVESGVAFVKQKPVKYESIKQQKLLGDKSE